MKDNIEHIKQALPKVGIGVLLVTILNSFGMVPMFHLTANGAGFGIFPNAVTVLATAGM